MCSPPHLSCRLDGCCATVALPSLGRLPASIRISWAKFPKRMRHFVDDKTVAGVVTLVAHGNDIVEFDAQGMADIEAARPMRKDSIFQIMSMTKPVTAIGIMMLAEEGKLAAARSRRAVPARVQEPARRHQYRPRRRRGSACPTTPSPSATC